MINACPFSWIRVPFIYGESLSGRTQEQVVEILALKLESLIDHEIEAKKTYTRAAERDYAEHLLSMVAKFEEKTGVKVKGTLRFKHYLDNRLSDEAVKKARARVRKQAQAKAEKTRKLIEKFKKGLKNAPLYPLLEKYVFNWKEWQFTDAEKKEREIFLASFDVENPSFVMVDIPNNMAITTQRVHVSLDEVRPLLKAWKHGHNIVGAKCGMYTVLANNDKMVKIGCHNIPVANIQALADILL